MQQLSYLTLHPPRATFGSTFGPMTPAGTVFARASDRWASSPVSSVDLYNPSKTVRQARLDARFGAEFSARLAIRLPSGEVDTLAIGPGGQNYGHTVTLRPGHNRVLFVTDIPVNANQRNYLDVANFRLIDQTAQSLALRASTELR